MPLTERIVYQPYTQGPKGKIVAGTSVPCRTAAEGLRRAEKAMAAGSVTGAHVVQVLADEEAGDYGEPQYLATLGIVPATD